MRNIAALVLLAVYSIVFAHNVIPHHHHPDHVAHMPDLLCIHAADGHHAHPHQHAHPHGHDQETKTEKAFQHSHPDEHQSHCHFEVKPVVSKIIDIAPNYLLTEEMQLPIPLEDEVTFTYIYYPRKLLACYNFAVPLRAPPVLA